MITEILMWVNYGFGRTVHHVFVVLVFILVFNFVGPTTRGRSFKYLLFYLTK